MRQNKGNLIIHNVGMMDMRFTVSALHCSLLNSHMTYDISKKTEIIKFEKAVMGISIYFTHSNKIMYYATGFDIQGLLVFNNLLL